MIRRLALSLVCICWTVPGLSESTLIVGATWVRAAPPTASVMAAYMTLTNPGNQDIKVVTITSPQFESIEMHRSVRDGGMARMVQQEHLLVPAHGKLNLAPESWHLMLMMPKTPLIPGDTVVLELHLKDQSRIRMTAPVQHKPPKNN